MMTFSFRRRRFASVLLSLGVVMGACGGDDDDLFAARECSAGETRECVGPGACKGGQACADGSWSECNCGAAGATGSGGSGAIAGAGGSAAASGSTSSGGVGGIGAAGGSTAPDGGAGTSASGAGGSVGGASGSTSTGGGAGSAGASGVGGSSGVAGSSGTGGSTGLPPHCANLPGPAMVYMGDDWCIDSTEVTRAHYLDFLTAKNGDTSGQIKLCENNTSYEPVSAWGGQYPNRPANWVDWCDAQAYCAWAGKRLCGSKQGGNLVAANSAGFVIATDWTVSQWAHACTNGGLTKFPYANTSIAGACPCITQADVQSHPQCKGIQTPFNQVWDLVGNGEWVDVRYSNVSMAGFPFVGKHATGDTSCSCNSFYVSQTASSWIGFRCCSL